MRLLRPLDVQGSICWLTRDLAVGCPSEESAWLAVRARGVRAVVDLSQDCGSVGDVVRRQGMRYLRLGVHRGGLPEAEELHIVTTWVLQRIREGGSVLLHDAEGRGNDALLACAVLVKDGSNAARAQAQLRNALDAALSQPQVSLLQQFVAQRVLASNGN